MNVISYEEKRIISWALSTTLSYTRHRLQLAEALLRLTGQPNPMSEEALTLPTTSASLRSDPAEILIPHFSATYPRNVAELLNAPFEGPGRLSSEH